MDLNLPVEADLNKPVQHVRKYFFEMENVKNKTVFVSPLDWGLGHATRCVAVIKALLHHNNKIILGVTPLTSPIFEEEFPEIETVNVPAYHIRYSSILPIWLKLMLDWKRITSVINKEKKVLEEIISKYNIDTVVSDNRFGLFSERTYNIFMTHQVFLKAPFANSLVQKINKKHILNFHELWVPDYADDEKCLSGALSHGKHFHSKLKYIGPQSRLIKNDAVKEKYDYLFFISGPEPQSIIFRDLLIKKSKKYPRLNFALVSNFPQNKDLKNVDCFISPNAKNLGKIINESTHIICRSGYSTLMDMHILGKNNLILIPTPGQTEQEYLAGYWRDKFGCKALNQSDIAGFKL